ncbi:pseudaminic acid synthase [Clostridium sp. UBA4548]|uniref:pseudaminic acid synthase n=1 Tax=Clostridium sp. UBA4548 TaxID=1946361 RepID=UPI0025C37A54|nr:pseudaminic acid synthase [Clostridium sp. UBA4548]
MNEISINGKSISGDTTCYIIAEMSANHNGSFENAVELIKQCAEAGVNAIKLQTYTADTITIDCDNKHFQISQGTLWDGKTLYDLYKEAYTPWEWQPKLKEIAEEYGLACFSSPFDKSSVDFLEDMNVECYKIASFEITDIPLIEYIASKNKPIIISTGVATLSDIENAVNACKKAGNDKIILLKCTSAYPAPYEEMNLRMIKSLSETFGVVSGLSDHSLGIEIPIAAVALGAKVIEKHVTLNRADGGPDAAFSLEPNELKDMVTAIRNTEKALGIVNYNLSEKSKTNREFARSLFVVKDIKAGESFTEENVRSIRPSYGLHPKYLDEIIGKISKEDLQKGTPLSWDFIE